MSQAPPVIDNCFEPDDPVQPETARMILAAVRKICAHGWGDVRIIVEKGHVAFVLPAESMRPPWERERREL
jgi:hypothetical protein